MTCIDGGPFEFLSRPYNYKRIPFQLVSGEPVTYEGIYFSLPASGLLLDKRLFSQPIQHPIDSSIKLYINKDINLTLTIEPDDDGAIYTSGTPHYIDYITDMRTLIAEVTELHAGDSTHPAKQFVKEHFTRTRATYDLSAHDVEPDLYIHPIPTNIIPSGNTSPGSSGSICPPGDGFELGAQALMDIDIDEIQWQPQARPTNQSLDTPAVIPVEPIFPAAIGKDGTATFSDLDVTNLNDLALGISTSGDLLLTGDLLIDGTTIKLSTGFGITPVGVGTFTKAIPWKLFPCEKELCRYYIRHEGQSGIISVQGRQAIYTAPSVPSTGVYMLAISKTSDTSGVVTQHYPSDYHSIDGVNASGQAHGGVHVVNKLIYNLLSDNLRTSSTQVPTAIGYSPINGKKVFMHWVGTERSKDFGANFGSSTPKYVLGNTIYGIGDKEAITLDPTIIFTNWLTTNHQLSPISWQTIPMEAQRFRRNPFTNRISQALQFFDSLASQKGIVSVLKHLSDRTVAEIVIPDALFGLGSIRRDNITTSVSQIFLPDGVTDGIIQWKLFSENVSQRNFVDYTNTFTSFDYFFNIREAQLVHVNGDVLIQHNTFSGARANSFLTFGETTTKELPINAHIDTVGLSIGFQALGLFRSVLNSTTVTINDQIEIDLSLASTITFDTILDFDESTITEFGPPVWDPDAGVNYLYFLAEDKMFFAHMDTDFMIIKINETDQEGFITGRPALLDI